MAENAEKTQKEFQKFCEEMDFAEIMRKMKEAKKAGLPFNCTEMMSRMMQMCCGGPKTKEGAAPETKNPAPGQ